MLWVSVLDLRSTVHGFDCWQPHCPAATLGKSLTHVCNASEVTTVCCHRNSISKECQTILDFHIKQAMLQVWLWQLERSIAHAQLQSIHNHRQIDNQFFYRPDAVPDIQPTASEHRSQNNQPVKKSATKTCGYKLVCGQQLIATSTFFASIDSTAASLSWDLWNALVWRHKQMTGGSLQQSTKHCYTVHNLVRSDSQVHIHNK